MPSTRTSRPRLPYCLLSRPAQLFLWIFAVAGLTRLLLAAMVLTRPSAPPVGEVIEALLLGPISDLRAAAWVTLGLWIAAALAPRRWREKRPIVWLGRIFLGAAFVGTLFAAAAELFFFEEFRSRFNFVAVDYLLYPSEVADNIWQSYPAGKVLLGLAVAVILFLTWIERRRSRFGLAPAPRGWPRVKWPISVFAFSMVTALWFPAAVAQPTADREVNEVAANGYVSFWRALLGDGETYRGLYASMEDGAALARVQREIDPRAALAGSFDPASTARPVASRPGRHAKNVVIVLEESFGSEFVRSLAPHYPYPVDLAPNFERISNEGTLFTRALSSGNRTIRAIEATTSSLPPLPGISIVRRSASEGLFTLPGVLAARGFETEFVYGGRAIFDEMGPYLAANGVHRIVDQGDFPAGTFHTAWGVSDEAIFERALGEADRLASSAAPFYMLVLSVSNHRPFAFPEDHLRRDARLKGRANAVRYADFALGGFIEQARARPWFADTLFVLMGDHGARVYGAAEIPVASYEVPILFLAPGIVPRGVRDDSLASSIDVPPTVLGLLGIGYESRFFGRDLFDPEEDEGRAYLCYDSNVALLEGERLALLGLRSSRELLRYRRGQDELDPLPIASAEERGVVDDAVAFYQTADELYRSGRYSLSAANPPG